MRQLHFLWLLSIAGCTTSNNERDSMDVPLSKAAAQEAIPKGKMLPHGTQIAWQRFFKPLPSIDERQELARKVKEPLANEDTRTLLQRARNEFTLGDYRAAETHLKTALRQDSLSLGATLDLIQIYQQTNRIKETFDFLGYAKDLIDSSDRISKEETFRYRYLLALAYIQRDERTKGHGILSDLIALDKEFTPGYAALGNSYLQIGKDKVAEFIAKRGLDRGENDPALLNILGVIASNKGDTTKAREFFSKALSKAPTFAQAMINQANTLVQEGDYDAAELTLTKAVSLAPNSAAGYVALGVCRRKMGRFKEAKVAFERALAIMPDNPQARFNMGVLAMENLGQKSMALRLFHEVTQIPNASEEIRRLARVYIDDLKENKPRE